ncbi:MAG: hypothetical protein GY855_06300 [candidate division Zixibacteria bacterium]|nr:hypothetical protein [candidate division Zixibacteria bacterium]
MLRSSMIRVLASIIIIYILIPIGILNAEEREAYVVHPTLGKTIDITERKAYGLFPRVENFQSAAIYINPDGTYTLEVKKWAWGKSKVISREIRKKEIDELALHMAYFNPSNKNAPFITQPDSDDSGSVFFRREDIPFSRSGSFKVRELKKPNAGNQLVAGVGGSLLGGIVGTGLGMGLFSTGASGIGTLYGMFFYSSIGGVIGSSIAVSKISSDCYPKGLYIGSLFGACAGFGTGIFIYRMIDIEVGYEVLVIFPALESIGATLFYNASRNYKIRHRGVIAGQLSDNKIEYSLLEFNIKRNPFNNAEIMPSVKFVQLNF